MWGGLGQLFGASRLIKTYYVNIANGMDHIVPGLSCPVIVTNFGNREVVIRQEANVGYVELLTTGVVQMPPKAARGATPVPGFTAPPDGIAIVGTVSGSPHDPVSGGSRVTREQRAGATATPARPRYPGRGGAPKKGGAMTARPFVAEVDLPDAGTAFHAGMRLMMDKHKVMWTGRKLSVIKATHHRIDLNAEARPVRFSPCHAGHTAREARQPRSSVSSTRTSSSRRRRNGNSPSCSFPGRTGPSAAASIIDC